LSQEPLPSVEVLQSALPILLQHDNYLGAFGNDNTTQEQQQQHSSLEFISRLGMAVRFLQLLVASPQLLAPATTPIILDLLQSLTSKTTNCLQQWHERRKNESESESESENDVDSQVDQDNNYFTGPIHDSYHAPQVVTFLVAFLLRTKSLFLTHRPDLLCALWKTLEALFRPLASQLAPELLQDALQGLVAIVKDFLQQVVGLLTATTGGLPIHMHPRQIKLASFFMTRMFTVLKIAMEYNQRLEDFVMKEILSLMLCLRGIPTAAVNHRHPSFDFLNACHKIATKAEKCISCLVMQANTKNDVADQVGIQFQRVHVKLLLGLKHSTEHAITYNLPATSKASRLLKDAFYIGKMETLSNALLQILHQPITSEDVLSFWNEEATVNLVLTVCEHLLFENLPTIHHLFASQALLGAKMSETAVTAPLDQLLHNCLRCVSDALFHCETRAPCMTTNIDRGAASLHRLVMRWLLPVNDNKQSTVLQHPLTRECVHAVIEFHAIRLSQIQSDSCIQCPSFVVLMVKLLFDARTRTCHRSALAVVLRNLLKSSAPVSRQLQSCIRAEYVTKIRLKFDLIRRKRNRNGKDKKENRSSPSNNKKWSSEDARIVGTVLSRLPSSIIPNLAVDIERFHLQIKSFTGENCRSKKLGLRTANTAILVLALLEAIHREDPANLKNDVSDGMDFAEVQHAVASWYLSLWKKASADGKSQHMDPKQLIVLASLGRSLLRLLKTNCERKSKAPLLTETQTNLVFELLQTVTGKAILSVIAASSSSNGTSLAHLVWEATKLLGCIVNGFPTANADHVFQGVIEIVCNLLVPETCWSYQALVIGSLHAFSSSLPKTQSHLLSTCLRKKRHKSLLQCRIKGFAFEYEKSSQQEGSKKSSSKRAFSSILELLNRCSRDLEHASGVMAIPRSLTAGSTNALSISLGSYFLTMPTQDGRKAIVIFPPEESSLADIWHMMAAAEQDDVVDEEEGLRQGTAPPGVQRLRNMKLSEDGGACKMILAPP